MAEMAFIDNVSTDQEKRTMGACCQTSLNRQLATCSLFTDAKNAACGIFETLESIGFEAEEVVKGEHI